MFSDFTNSSKGSSLRGVSALPTMLQAMLPTMLKPVLLLLILGVVAIFAVSCSQGTPATPFPAVIDVKIIDDGDGSVDGSGKPIEVDEDGVPIIIMTGLQFKDIGNNKVLRTDAFTLSSDSSAQPQGIPVTLDLIVEPIPAEFNIHNVVISWSTSDENVVDLVVDPADPSLVFLTAVRPGSSIITASAGNGISVELNVTVGNYPVTSIAWDEEKYMVYSSDRPGYRAYDLSRNITLLSDTMDVLPTDMRVKYTYEYAYGGTAKNHARIYLNEDTGDLRIYDTSKGALDMADIAVTATTFDGEFAATTMLSLKYRYSFTQSDLFKDSCWLLYVYGEDGNIEKTIKPFFLGAFYSLGYHYVSPNTAVLIKRGGERRSMQEAGVHKNYGSNEVRFCSNTAEDVMEELVFNVGLDTYVRAGLKWVIEGPLVWDGLSPYDFYKGSAPYWAKYIGDYTGVDEDKNPYNDEYKGSTEVPTDRAGFNNTYSPSNYLRRTYSLAVTYSLDSDAGVDSRLSILKDTSETLVYDVCDGGPMECMTERVNITASAKADYGLLKVGSIDMFVGYSMLEGENSIFNPDLCLMPDGVERFPFFMMGRFNRNDMPPISRKYSSGSESHVKEVWFDPTDQNNKVFADAADKGSLPEAITTVFCYDLEGGGAPSGSQLTLDLGVNGMRSVPIPTSKPRQITWLEPEYLTFGLSDRRGTEDNRYATYQIADLIHIPDNSNFHITDIQFNTGDGEASKYIEFHNVVNTDGNTEGKEYYDNAELRVMLEKVENPVNSGKFIYKPYGAGNEVQFTLIDTSGAEHNMSMFIAYHETELDVANEKIDTIDYRGSCATGTSIYYTQLEVSADYTEHIGVVSTSQGLFKFHETGDIVTGCAEGDKTTVSVKLGLDTATWDIYDPRAKWSETHYLARPEGLRTFFRDQIVAANVATGEIKIFNPSETGSLYYTIQSLINYYTGATLNPTGLGVSITEYCRINGTPGLCDKINKDTVVGDGEYYRDADLTLPKTNPLKLTVNSEDKEPKELVLTAVARNATTVVEPTAKVLFNYEFQVLNEWVDVVVDGSNVKKVNYLNTSLHSAACGSHLTLALFTGVPPEYWSAIRYSISTETSTDDSSYISVYMTGINHSSTEVGTQETAFCYNTDGSDEGLLSIYVNTMRQKPSDKQYLEETPLALNIRFSPDVVEDVRLANAPDPDTDTDPDPDPDTDPVDVIDGYTGE